jgi:ribosomal protein S16
MSEQTDVRSLELVGTVAPQYRNGSIEITPGTALDAAGLSAASSLFFQDDGGVLVAVGTDYEADGRSDRDGRPIHQRGRVTIPKHFHEAVDLDVETVRKNGPRLAVYASEGVLAFRPVDELDITVDWGEVPG